MVTCCLEVYIEVIESFVRGLCDDAVTSVASFDAKLMEP